MIQQKRNTKKRSSESGIAKPGLAMATALLVGAAFVGYAPFARGGGGSTGTTSTRCQAAGP